MGLVDMRYSRYTGVNLFADLVIAQASVTAVHSTRTPFSSDVAH